MDLVQLRFALPYIDRRQMAERMLIMGGGLIHCPTCGRAVDLSFMRRCLNENIRDAVCLPCFLKKHYIADEDDINKMINIGNDKGFYRQPAVAA